MAEDEIDSRNAAFSKKRCAEDDNASDGSLSKRPRSSDGPNVFGGWNRGVRSTIRPSLGRPRLGSGRGVPTAADKLEAAGQTVKRSTSPSLQFNVPRPASSSEKARVAQQPIVEPHGAGNDTSSEEGEIQSAFSGDDEAVVINVADGTQPENGTSGNESHDSEDDEDESDDDESDQDGDGDSDSDDSDRESGEISEEDEEPPTGLDGAADSADGIASVDKPRQQVNGMRNATSYRPPSPEIVHLENDDGSSMQHRHGRKTKPPANSVPVEETDGPPPAMITLADLGLEELQLQLRYYHIGQNPATIPLTEPARCLACAAIGHASRNCPELKCRHCRKYNEHFSEDCPDVVICNKCGKSGHGSQVCPFKLRPAEEDLECEICGCGHHSSQDCESHWRTSRFPPFNSITGSGARLYCYECGDAGHLGNDCHSRMPGKGAGSSMWSVKTMPGGIVPVSAWDHGRGPIPLSNNQKRKLERHQKREVNDDPAPLVKRAKIDKPKNTKIKFNTDIAQNRSDLADQRKEADKRPAAPSKPAAPAPKNKNKKSKKPKKTGKKSAAGGGQKGVKPMPSAAKKAFVKGKS